MKRSAEISRFIDQQDYAATPEGLLIHGGILARGRYVHCVNGQDSRLDTNLVPAEGIAYLLDAGLGSGPKLASWYLTVFSGSVNPASTWTAANFAVQASEITSTSEGFSNTTRPLWTPGATSAGVIGNLSAKSVFNIVCTTSANISGAALLSDATRGGTNGKLISAARFSSVRQVYSGDTFDLGYEVELLDS